MITLVPNDVDCNVDCNVDCVIDDDASRGKVGSIKKFHKKIS